VEVAETSLILTADGTPCRLHARAILPSLMAPTAVQVDHDLSVPAVSTILLSMLFWTAGHAAAVLLAEQAPAALPSRLASAAAAVTLPVEIGVRTYREKIENTNANFDLVKGRQRMNLYMIC